MHLCCGGDNRHSTQFRQLSGKFVCTMVTACKRYGKGQVRIHDNHCWIRPLIQKQRCDLPHNDPGRKKRYNCIVPFKCLPEDIFTIDEYVCIEMLCYTFSSVLVPFKSDHSGSCATPYRCDLL